MRSKKKYEQKPPRDEMNNRWGECGGDLAFTQFHFKKKKRKKNTSVLLSQFTTSLKNEVKTEKIKRFK